MGMDILVCHLCEEGFSDYGEYGYCATCEKTMCGRCLDEMITKYECVDEESEFAEDYGEYNPKTCDVCTGEIIEETEFVKFLVKKIGMTREKLEEEFKQLLKESKIK